jgi:hypothetical protein
MMRLGSVVRGLALLGLAVAVGWWARGGGTTVLAQKSSSSSSARGSDADSNLAFQFVGAGSQQSLAIYNPDNRTLYVYPRVGEGNSHVSCEYSFSITRPGAAIDRQNCPVGDQVR